jgi:hypothetical protein
VIWSVIELGIGIIVISLPSCRPIFRSIPFFAAMSAAGSKNMPTKQPTHTKHSWPTQRSAEKGSFQLKDLESSMEGKSVGDVETFLSVSSLTRDVEDGIQNSSGY